MDRPPIDDRWASIDLLPRRRSHGACAIRGANRVRIGLLGPASCLCSARASAEASCRRKGGAGLSCWRRLHERQRARSGIDCSALCSR